VTDSSRVNREFDSNVMNERNLSSNKYHEQRRSTLRRHTRHCSAGCAIIFVSIHVSLPSNSHDIHDSGRKAVRHDDSSRSMPDISRESMNMNNSE
jgi:hypothetical protein